MHRLNDVNSVPYQVNQRNGSWLPLGFASPQPHFKQQLIDVKSSTRWDYKFLKDDLPSTNMYDAC